MTEKTLPADTQTLTRRRAKPRPRTLILMLIAVLIALIAGIYWWLTARWIMDTDDAYVRADIVIFAPRINGYLTAVNVDDNQHVNKGDVLAEIDARDYQARVEQAEAGVGSAMAEKRLQQANILTLEAQQKQQQNRIDAARAAVQAAAAESTYAAREGRRQHLLASENVNSNQQLELAIAQKLRAAAALIQANAQLAIAEKAQTVMTLAQQAAEAERDKAVAQQQQAEASLKLAQINLASTQIRSPITGTVGENRLRRGQYVETGSPLLAVVPDNIYVVANFKETQVNSMRVGQPVDITVDAFNGQHLHGKVESLAPASGAQFALLPPDNATGNFTKIVQRMPVKIRLDSTQTAAGNIRPGMSVLVSVDTHHG